MDQWSIAGVKAKGWQVSANSKDAGQIQTIAFFEATASLLDS